MHPTPFWARDGAPSLETTNQSFSGRSRRYKSLRCVDVDVRAHIKNLPGHFLSLGHCPSCLFPLTSKSCTLECQVPQCTAATQFFRLLNPARSLCSRCPLNLLFSALLFRQITVEVSIEYLPSSRRPSSSLPTLPHNHIFSIPKPFSFHHSLPIFAPWLTSMPICSNPTLQHGTPTATRRSPSSSVPLALSWLASRFCSAGWPFEKSRPTTKVKSTLQRLYLLATDSYYSKMTALCGESI